MNTKTPRYQLLIVRGFGVFSSIFIAFGGFKLMSFMSFMPLAFPLGLNSQFGGGGNCIERPKR